MIKNYIFDIGNVLVDFHPIPFFEKLLPGKQMEVVCGLVFGEEWEKIDEGLYTGQQVRSYLLQIHPLFSKQIECIFDHWMEMMTPYEDTISYMKELKACGYPVYLLSNIGEESHQYLCKTYDFFDIADGMMLSYKIRCNKPNHKIYKALLDTYQLDAKECIFFDDRIQNIESARALGMQGIHFENMEQARNEVKKYVID